MSGLITNLKTTISLRSKKYAVNQPVPLNEPLEQYKYRFTLRCLIKQWNPRILALGSKPVSAPSQMFFIQLMYSKGEEAGWGFGQLQPVLLM